MEVAMDIGEARIRRRPIIRLRSRPPLPLTPEAQRIYDGLNEMKISDPERFRALMEELDPKPVEPVKYYPEVLKKCQDAVFRKFGPAKMSFIPNSVADLSEAACATEHEAYTYTRMANSSPNQLLFNIINPATRLPDQVFKDMIILRYRHQEESSETPTTSSSGVPHALLGSSSSSSVLKRHREDSTETLVAPSGSGMLKRHREDLGESSEPMVADSSAPTSGLVADEKGEDPGDSASEKVATTCGGDN